ncbi:transposase [Alloprevotella sp. OH1205_COT-284]|uniref:transposase n=1 Tax=Alloprevotella sp. OH1205_COT-284 TaxID=2491043 RepID=UPI001315192C
MGEAYSLREGLVEALNWPNRSEGLKQFLRWLELAKQSTLVPFKKVANFFQNHLFGIRTYFEKGAITNGLFEALNAKIQLAKRRARGFANIQSFINMIYYINGGENFAYPLKTL